MRKILSAIRACVVSACLASVLAFVACSNDIDSASTTAGMDNSADDDMVLNDNDGKSDKTNRKDTNTGSGSDSSGGTVKDFGDNFIRGFDASAVDYFENVYASSNTWTDKNWYDSDGSKDIFALLADHGFNTIRLRVWVDPMVTSTISNDSVWPTSTSVENAWKNGDCTKERAARLAKRAKAAGMKVLLDFHLSDYWTDPSVQLIPKSWQSVTSAGEMKEKLTSHITEVLQYMKDNSVTPDYVQVGNEIDRGMLVDASVDAGTSPKTATSAASSISGGINSENFKTYLKAGCAAVRDFDEDIKIIIHITAKNSDRFAKVEASGADYDIIGLSYYSWENHGTMDELIAKIGNLESTYSKKVMVVETSFAALDYGDSDDMTQAATNLSAKNYSDVTIESNAVVPSEDVQKAILRHTMQEVYGAGGIGICIWGGERRDYQYGLFDWDGNTYKAIDAFNYKPSDGYPAENSSDGNSSEDTGGGTEESYDEMTLTLKFDGFTIAGGSVNVNYGADSGTYADASGEVSSDGTSATAKLSKTYANSSNWFNNITITVKNSSGTTVDVEYTNYFEFNASGAELKVNAGSAKKTFTINFDGFTIVGGSVEGVKFSNAWANSSSEWENTNITTPTVTVATDGKSASFTVEKSQLTTEKTEFYIDWSGVTVKDSSSNAVTLASVSDDYKNKWYGWSDGPWEYTLQGDTGGGTEADTMTVTLVFDDFECTYMKLWYGDSSGEDVEVTLADDKKSATFIAKKSFANDSGWYGNMSLHNVWNGNTDLSNKLAAASGSNLYFEFNAAGTTIHLVDNSASSNGD